MVDGGFRLGLLVLVAVTACEGSGGGKVPGDAGAEAGVDGGVIPLTGLSAAVGQVICGKRYACCSADEITRGQFSPDEAGCKRGLDQFFVLTLPELERSIAAGRSAYDGAALGRCLASYQGLTCAEARAGVPPPISLAGCPYLVPRLALGATCGQGFECKDGYCKGVTLAGDDGVCTARKPDGEPCLTQDECTGGFCDPDSELCERSVARPVCESAQ